MFGNRPIGTQIRWMGYIDAQCPAGANQETNVLIEQPIITQIQARAILAPFNLTPRSASGSLSHAALVLIDINTSANIVGRAYLFAFSPSMLTPLVETIKALSSGVIDEPLAPASITEKLHTQLRLLDTPGLVGLALSGIDMALWDAHSQHAGLPLASLLGSNCNPVPAYNSCGLWIQNPNTIADEAQALLEMHNFDALKLRIGRSDAEEDLAAARNVRERIGPKVHLMSDFNQSQSIASAISRSRMLDNEGLYWIEEPVRHADYSGCAQVRQSINTAVQIGENLCSEFQLMSAISAGAAQYYMPDVQRIGGVTG